MNFLRQLLAGIADAWNRLSLSARVNIVLASLATVVVVGMLVYMGSQPTYVSLYRQIELSEEDVAAIRDVLLEKGTPYKLADQGRTIEVPLKERSQLLIDLANQNLPKGRGSLAGFEIFDETNNLTATQFQQQVNYQRALMGALQQMLVSLDFVENAHVIIREAEEKLFIKEQQPSKAAVTLEVNRQPSDEEVDGILAIVSTFGGPNLDPDNVTVTTTDGVALHLPARDGFERAAISKQEHHLSWERRREQAIEDALAAMGVQSVAQVALQIDYSRKTEREETVTAGAAVSTMATERTLTSRESLPEGPAGALANVPGGMGPREVVTEEEEQEEVENTEPSRKTTEIVTEPGTISTAQVTVIVDQRYQPEVGEDGQETGNREPVARTQEELDKFASLVAHAVGFGVTPEDVLMYDQPFQLEGLAQGVSFEEAQAAAWWAAFQEKAWTGAKIALVLISFLIVRWLFLRSVIIPEEEEEAEAGYEPPEPSAEELRKREIAAEVERLSREEPDTVASLLRSWLSESEE